MKWTTFSTTRVSKGWKYVYQMIDELEKKNEEKKDSITEEYMYAVNGRLKLHHDVRV